MRNEHPNESVLANSLLKLSDKIMGISNRMEAVPGKRLELTAVFVYAVAHLVMAIFHEPWYDEAVAWQIARCASLQEILFEIPHYEGHPPLWHLILLPFAKLGAPYELSLTLVSLIFAGMAIGLIVFRSPFPRIVRLLLPFTYFFFYQYGVISRPYCVMMLAFVLLAISYQRRNEKPGYYVLFLMLLCLTSAYGIVIAGGLAIVWVWEIWNLQNLGRFLKTFRTDRRIWWLAALLALALLLIAEIMPRDDTYAIDLITDLEDNNSLLVCLLYMLFGLPLDVSLISIYSTYTILNRLPLDISILIPICFLGAIFWWIVILLGKKKKTVLLLLIPYGMYAVFSALVYISPHHIGLGLLVFVFWFWVSSEAKDKVALQLKEREIIQNLATVFLALSLIVSLFWSVFSCALDVCFLYASGREDAAFIKENGLDQCNIMVEWDVFYHDEAVTGMDTNHCWYADNVLPYAEGNLFFNYNDGNDQKAYSTHKLASEEENQEALMNWSQCIPDVLYKKPKLDLVYGDSVSYLDYRLVYSKLCSKIWKGKLNYGQSNIYVRNELAEELGLTEVEPAYPKIMDLLVRINMLDEETYKEWMNE